MGFLMDNCCQGNPEMCRPASPVVSNADA
jgi:hypothetical protein